MNQKRAKLWINPKVTNSKFTVCGPINCNAIDRLHLTSQSRRILTQCVLTLGVSSPLAKILRELPAASASAASSSPSSAGEQEIHKKKQKREAFRSCFVLHSKQDTAKQKKNALVSFSHSNQKTEGDKTIKKNKRFSLRTASERDTLLETKKEINDNKRNAGKQKEKTKI